MHDEEQGLQQELEAPTVPDPKFAHDARRGAERLDRGWFNVPPRNFGDEDGDFQDPPNDPEGNC